ncbi:hypothetical protein PL8927_380103 [Planktothrix serta PCC 8927]|uniref:Uncharacterized protein n=1 Tax=Planktothrix serta PCC 8927 TaxID=671068 RepID=A0A7Z9DWG5_9CYAN|nr:hypothetical protein PL8927_380103 [Planktothrix serta PCC 8927]
MGGMGGEIFFAGIRITNPTAIMARKQASGERDANYLKQRTRGIYRCSISQRQL